MISFNVKKVMSISKSFRTTNRPFRIWTQHFTFHLPFHFAPAPLATTLSQHTYNVEENSELNFLWEPNSLGTISCCTKMKCMCCKSNWFFVILNKLNPTSLKNTFHKLNFPQKHLVETTLSQMYISLNVHLPEITFSRTFTCQKLH